MKKMKKGFTLVEVTVALALFGIAVVVLTQSFLGGMFSLESFNFDKPEDDALIFIHDQVISQAKQSIENGGSINTVTHGVAKWGGTVQSTSVFELYKVILNVSFEGDKSSLKPKNYTQTFYLYRPEWAESAERDAFFNNKGTQKS